MEKQSLDMIAKLVSSPLEKIGQGYCGTVWSSSHSYAHSAVILKRQHTSDRRPLENEFQMHRRISEALESNLFKSVALSFSLPQSHVFLSPTDDNWSQILPWLPEQSLANGLISERIPALSKRVCDWLMNHHVSPEKATGLLKPIEAEHCLVRPYLGYRRHIPETKPQSAPRLQVCHLRNYPLPIDKMQELGLSHNLEEYARSMAIALAFLHWCVKIDGRGVEFVLARPRPRSTKPCFYHKDLGRHRIWMLDCDGCQRMKMNEEGVRQAIKAFWWNDPFYPRPGKENETDQWLWNCFRKCFLIASIELMRRSGMGNALQELPWLLIRGIEETAGTFL